MRWSGDFGSYERHTAASVLTRTYVFVCVGVFLFLCLFTPSVSHALCPDEIDVDSLIPTLYSGVERNKFDIVGESDSPAKWNVLGVRHLHNWRLEDTEEDIRKAREYFRKAEEDKYPPALHNLGVIHLNGWGVDEDIGKAKEYFERALKENKDYFPAQNNLGVIKLREALNDPRIRDASDAERRIQQAADVSYPPALNNLGILHLGKQNYAEAINYLERAAKLNYAPALFNLGALYARGYDGHRNYQKAAELYEKAARKGNIDAQYSLGLMYSQGVGVEKSLLNSFIWLGVAEERDSAEAEKVRSLVEKLLTEEQVSEATSCVREINPKIHAMDPFTLYDDVVAAPELYDLSEDQFELSGSWSWISTYPKKTQE